MVDFPPERLAYRGATGEAPKLYLPEVVKLFEDPSASVRAAAVSAFGATGEGAKPYLSQIVELLQICSAFPICVSCRMQSYFGKTSGRRNDVRVDAELEQVWSFRG